MDCKKRKLQPHHGVIDLCEDEDTKPTSLRNNQGALQTDGKSDGYSLKVRTKPRRLLVLSVVVCILVIKLLSSS